MVITHSLPGICARIVHELTEVGQHCGLGRRGQVGFCCVLQIAENKFRNGEGVKHGGLACLAFVYAMMGPGHSPYHKLIGGPAVPRLIPMGLTFVLCAVLIPAAKEDTVLCVLLNTVSLVAMVTSVVVYVLPNNVTVWHGDVTVYVLPAVIIFAPSVLQVVLPIVEAMLAEFIFGRVLLHLKPVGFGCREPHFQQWRRWLMETETVRKKAIPAIKDKLMNWSYAVQPGD